MTSLSLNPRRILYAAETGNIICVRKCLQEGIDPDFIGKGSDNHSEIYKSAISCAAEKGHLRTVQLLLDHNANIYSSCGKTSPPLYYAALNGHANVFMLIINSRKIINLSSESLRGILCGAISHDHVAMAEVILNLGAEVERLNVWESPLMFAAGRGNSRMVELLLERSADVNAKHVDGTALIKAVEGRNIETIGILLRAGADINGVDKYGRTALIKTAGTKGFRIAELLLQHGADVNATDADGVSALMLACKQELYNHTTELIEVLLENGADIYAESNDGTSVTGYCYVPSTKNFIENLQNSRVKGAI